MRPPAVAPTVHSREHAWAVAATVTDPEVPVLTIEDLGVLREVEVDGDRATVTITPTYSGCPALEAMRDDVVLALIAAGVAIVVAIILVLRGKAQPATIAIVAQVPALATVALITQYSIMLWIVIGFAATSQLALRPLTHSNPARIPSFAP